MKNETAKTAKKMAETAETEVGGWKLVMENGTLKMELKTVEKT